MKKTLLTSSFFIALSIFCDQKKSTGSLIYKFFHPPATSSCRSKYLPQHPFVPLTLKTMFHDDGKEREKLLLCIERYSHCSVDFNLYIFGWKTG